MIYPRLAVAGSLVVHLTAAATQLANATPPARASPTTTLHRAPHESPAARPVPSTAASRGSTIPARPTVRIRRGQFEAVQANVDAFGNDIVGDAASEPTIAQDPNDPHRLIIGWRQFNDAGSGHREAGYAFSHDGGANWAFPGTLATGSFGSDPVLDVDSHGNFYYLSIDFIETRLFRTYDGGVSWAFSQVNNQFWDKPWMCVDRSGLESDGTIYISGVGLARSFDGGMSFQFSSSLGGYWGTSTVDHSGKVYHVDSGGTVTVSSSASDPTADPIEDHSSECGVLYFGTQVGPNPNGLLGHAWIATNHAVGPRRGEIYVLGALPFDANERSDVAFTLSANTARTWSQPKRLNDDPNGNGAWHWFGMMAVAPSGRIDVAWYDTRNTGSMNQSELYFTSSLNGGRTWLPNIAVTPPFDTSITDPSGKLGDYCGMTSDDEGANIAFTATFLGAPDIYFVRIPCQCDCNNNGTMDSIDIANDTSQDENDNLIPDECEKPRVFFVDGQAKGRNDGATWADAFVDLSDALDAAAHHGAWGGRSEVWVKGGVYKPGRGNSQRDATFRVAHGVNVYGGFQGHEAALVDRMPRFPETTLSCDFADNDADSVDSLLDNCHYAVSLIDVTDAVLERLTVTGGHQGFNEPVSPAATFGSGIRIQNSFATLDTCRIHRNYARTYPGVHIVGGQVWLQRCTITENASETVQSRLQGAVGSVDAHVQLISCLFAGNRCRPLRLHGSFQIINCTIAHNWAPPSVQRLREQPGAIVNSVFWNADCDLSRQHVDLIIEQSSATNPPDVFYSIIPRVQGELIPFSVTGDNPLFARSGACHAQGVSGPLDDVWDPGDYRLEVTSPARDSDTTWSGPASVGKRDLDGHSRILCNKVDLGAYESGFGDVNCDDLIDLQDFREFVSCHASPQPPPASACIAFDSDADADADLFDFARFQLAVRPNE